jgi:uncharacterized protein YpmB
VENTSVRILSYTNYDCDMSHTETHNSNGNDVDIELDEEAQKMVEDLMKWGISEEKARRRVKRNIEVRQNGEVKTPW